MEVNILRSKHQQLLTVHHETQIGKEKEKERIMSHITRVNSVSASSKIIFPKRIIKELGLNWKDDYIEWRVEYRGGHKVVTVRKSAL